MPTNPWLPADYTPPTENTGRYMKLKDGANRLRILGSPLIGYEAWTYDKKPVRTPLNKPFTTVDLDGFKDGLNGEKVVQFWALPVYNFEDRQIQVLVFKQKTIMRELTMLSKSEDWGSPLDYNLTINRIKEGDKISYSVQPAPPKANPKILVDEWNELQKNFDLEALFTGGDPFNPGNANTGQNEAVQAAVSPSGDEDINIDDIPF